MGFFVMTVGFSLLVGGIFSNNSVSNVDIITRLKRIEEKIDHPEEKKEEKKPTDELTRKERIDRKNLELNSKTLYFTVLTLLFAMSLFAYSTGHYYVTAGVLVITIIIAVKFNHDWKEIENIFEK